MNSETLIIGYGNELRADDGAGIVVARRIEGEHLPETQVRLVHQLLPEVLEEACRAGRTILIDAAEQGPEVNFRRVTEPGDSMTSSHHCGPALLLSLADKIYHKPLELYLCTIRGEHFDFAQGISPMVVNRVRRAVHVIEKFISGGCHA